MNKQLKSCPFCGSNIIELLPIQDGYKIRCVICDASVYEISNYKKQAIAKWNKRNIETNNK